MIRLLRRVNAGFASFELSTITVLLIILFIINAYAVGGRYLFSSYPPWIIEVSEALLVYIVFLGGAWLYREKRQIAVTAFVDLLPANSRIGQAVRIIGDVSVLIFAILVVWQAARYQPILLNSNTPVLGLPKNVSSMMVPVAYLSIALAGLERIVAPVSQNR